jgi:hypothetical protein
MALYHTLRDEPEEAALLAAAAEATEQDFARSPLCRVLLERFLDPGAGTERHAASESGPLEDPLGIEGPARDDEEGELGTGLTRELAAELGDDIPDLFKAVTGRPARRQHLKARFFTDIEEPRGRDLLLLDLTEAVTLGLQRALSLLPGDVRPRICAASCSIAVAAM